MPLPYGQKGQFRKPQPIPQFYNENLDPQTNLALALQLQDYAKSQEGGDPEAATAALGNTAATAAEQSRNQLKAALRAADLQQQEETYRQNQPTQFEQSIMGDVVKARMAPNPADTMAIQGLSDAIANESDPGRKAQLKSRLGEMLNTIQQKTQAGMASVGGMLRPQFRGVMGPGQPGQPPTPQNAQPQGQQAAPQANAPLGASSTPPTSQAAPGANLGAVTPSNGGGTAQDFAGIFSDISKGHNKDLTATLASTFANEAVNHPSTKGWIQAAARNALQANPQASQEQVAAQVAQLAWQGAKAVDLDFGTVEANPLYIDVFSPGGRKLKMAGNVADAMKTAARPIIDEEIAKTRQFNAAMGAGPVQQ